MGLSNIRYLASHLNKEYLMGLLLLYLLKFWEKALLPT